MTEPSGAHRGWSLAELSLRRPVTAMMVFVSLVAIGLIALLRLCRIHLPLPRHVPMSDPDDLVRRIAVEIRNRGRVLLVVAACADRPAPPSEAPGGGRPLALTRDRNIAICRSRCKRSPKPSSSIRSRSPSSTLRVIHPASPIAVMTSTRATQTWPSAASR